DAEEKIHKLYTPYWTEEAINKFMQPYSVVKGKYCSTMGDWGEMGGHIDRVTILKKERIGKELMKINVNVKEPDGSSVQPEIYELKYVDGKWLVNLSPMMSAL
ncbi:MAG: DL-endopeptidase inhibitor IseA family protein, partial [Syntrophomonas sp.]